MSDKCREIRIELAPNTDSELCGDCRFADEGWLFCVVFHESIVNDDGDSPFVRCKPCMEAEIQLPSGNERKSEDIHEKTIRELFGLGPDDEVSPEQRRCAKAINFGKIYGGSTLGGVEEDVEEI